MNPWQMAMRELRWGIIGCGDVTETKSGPAFQKVARSSIVAVMRRDGAKAADYARRHGIARHYDNAGELIGDPEVDAIYVATPPDSHAGYAIKAAQAGKPVYVEKPMARTLPECEAMIEACHTAGVPLFVAYYRRALPRFQKVKELLDAGVIGEVQFVQVQHFRRAEACSSTALDWRLNPTISGGGLFVDLGSHTLDVLDFLLGPITACNGHATNRGRLSAAEDTVAGSFVFASGALGTGMWCFAAGEDREMNEIIGTLGRLLFSTFGADPVVLKKGSQTEEWRFEPPLHIQQPLIQSVVDDILDGTTHCPSTGATAFRTNWVMDSLLTDFRATQTGFGSAASSSGS